MRRNVLIERELRERERVERERERTRKEGRKEGRKKEKSFIRVPIIIKQRKT